MRHTASWLIGLVLGSTLSLAFGGPIQRQVGKVEQVDLEEGLIILDQLVTRGRHLRRLIYVRPDTEILAARRLRPWEMRGTQAFEEIPVTLPDVVTGDFVVVESLQEGSRAVARRITVVETVQRLRSSP